MLALSQATGNRHLLIAAADGALEALSKAPIEFTRRGRQVSTSIHGEMSKIIGPIDDEPALSGSEMRLFDYAPASTIIGAGLHDNGAAEQGFGTALCGPDQQEEEEEETEETEEETEEEEREADIGELDLPGAAPGRLAHNRRSTKQEKVKLPPLEPLQATFVDVLVNKPRGKARFVPPVSRRETKQAKAIEKEEKEAAKAAAVAAKQAAVAAAAVAAGQVPKAAAEAQGKKMKSVGGSVNKGQVQKLGHNCCLQQEFFQADMSELRKKRLFVEGLVGVDEKGKPAISSEMTHKVRRLNYTTRPPDTVGQFPTRLVAGAYNEDSPFDESYEPQPDFGENTGAFHVAKADEGGYYSSGEGSAIAKFEAANTDVKKLAVLRQLVSFACIQNGAPLSADSFVFPSDEVLRRHKKPTAAKRPAVKRAPSGYNLWRNELGRKSVAGEWLALEDGQKKIFVERAACAATAGGTASR